MTYAVTVASPGSDHVPPADVRLSALDEALLVLQGTRDGDLLDRRDLGLLQLIVNNGVDALSPLGLARWREVVQQVAGRSYVKPWFHDIEHLTRDHQGYVSWKGVRVEHYSFGENREGERKAALRLGAYCRYLERQGRAVDGRELFRLLDEVTYGQGLDIKRFAVIWRVVEELPTLVVVPLGESDARACMQQMANARAEAAFSWGAGLEVVRAMQLVTKEDFDKVRECIRQDYDVMRMHWRSGSTGWRTCSTVLDRLEQAIPQEQLPTSEDVRHRVLAEGQEPVAIGDNTSSSAAFGERASAPRARDRG
jgi:hypothetical protein